MQCGKRDQTIGLRVEGVGWGVGVLGLIELTSSQLLTLSSSRLSTLHIISDSPIPTTPISPFLCFHFRHFSFSPLLCHLTSHSAVLSHSLFHKLFFSRPHEEVCLFLPQNYFPFLIQFLYFLPEVICKPIFARMKQFLRDRIPSDAMRDLSCPGRFFSERSQLTSHLFRLQ